MNSEIIELSYARSNDKITVEGNERSAYSLIKPIEFINNVHDGIIKQFQIEELSDRSYVYHLVMDSNMYGEISEMLREFLRRDLGECDVKIHICDCIEPNPKTGKLKWLTHTD